MKEQDLLETKLRSYEKEKTSFAPALEETQWEVRMRAWAGDGQGFSACIPHHFLQVSSRL